MHSVYWPSHIALGTVNIMGNDPAVRGSTASCRPKTILHVHN